MVQETLIRPAEKEHPQFDRARFLRMLTEVEKPQSENRVVEVDNLKIDIDAFRATCNSQEVKFSPTEFTMLVTFASNFGKVVPYKKLAEIGWGTDIEFDLPLRDCINKHAQRIRARLLQTSPSLRLRNVRSIGFCLEETSLVSSHL